jgi:hypothetical protein
MNHAQELPLPILAYSVEQFCKAHNISKATFYKLKKENRAPREMKVDGRPRISAEAAADWRRAMEAESDAA